MAASAIYEGTVRHSRAREVDHSFAFPVWLLWLDLEEAESGLDVGSLFSTRRPAPLRWRRPDHFGDPRSSLAECARDLVQERCGTRPVGPVRLLTMARTLGMGYNPVSFFYLYDEGEQVQAAIAEVTSTPWGERCHYVMARDGDAPLRGRFSKEMHVSPFMPMDQGYAWAAGDPGDRLGLRIANTEGEREVFSASLALRHRPLTGRRLARLLFTRAPQPQLALAHIYGQAVRLKLRGAEYHRRPREIGPA
jgi:DUF1365 family protein